MYVRGTEEGRRAAGENYMCGEAVALVTGGAAESSPLSRTYQVGERGYEGSLCP